LIGLQKFSNVFKSFIQNPLCKANNIFKIVSELTCCGCFFVRLDEEKILYVIGNKGQAKNIPSLFKKDKFDYWKQCMISLFKLYKIDIMNMIENDKYIHVD